MANSSSVFEVQADFQQRFHHHLDPRCKHAKRRLQYIWFYLHRSQDSRAYMAMTSTGTTLSSIRTSGLQWGIFIWVSMLFFKKHQQSLLLTTSDRSSTYTTSRTISHFSSSNTKIYLLILFNLSEEDKLLQILHAKDYEALFGTCSRCLAVIYCTMAGKFQVSFILFYLQTRLLGFLNFLFYAGCQKKDWENHRTVRHSIKGGTCHLAYNCS